jgi:leucyl-tRNA synthetase
MTDEVWDYVMLDGPVPKSTKISSETLEHMRREFNFFYPMDLRCSGKDLISNHLMFCLYNHTAIFPKEKWPRAMRPNGHLLLNSEKMSKSTGNFMSLFEAVERYGADATRFALADAGDGLEDANFVAKTADDAVLKLFTEKELCEEMIADAKNGRLRNCPESEFTWNDRVFRAEMVRIVKQADAAYSGMLYREALKNAYYDLQNAKGEYRKACLAPNGSTEQYEGLHHDLVMLYVELQSIMMMPITPHWSEYLYSTLLGKVSIYSAIFFVCDVF